jgi:hypothetical protein
MIVYVGDWIKTNGKWRQVVAVDPVADLFAVLGLDDAENLVWYGTEVPEVFGGHLSDLEIQEKLEGLA